jgi:hypothetical protein
MKSFTIDIHPKLQAVTFSVKNGRKFSDHLIKGEYGNFEIKIYENDLKRVKQFAVKNADDKNSNRGNWYAHCNGFAMDLIIDYKGYATINTYRPYGRYSKK